jgi:cell volume regulation protein A
MTTGLIMRMFIFIVLGTQVDFAMMNQYLWGGVAVFVVGLLVAPGTWRGAQPPACDA